MSTTYSLPQIWNLNAQSLNESVRDGFCEPVPVSADAWLRARARALRAGLAWETVKSATLLRINPDEVPDYSKERREYSKQTSAVACDCHVCAPADFMMEVPC